MYIKRESNGRRVKRLLHKVADLQGGITISKEGLNGPMLYEGTPFGYGENGVGVVFKTAGVKEKADEAAKAYKVGKEHHFGIGDTVALDGGKVASTITKIDKKDVAHDVVTVKESLGAAEVGAVIYETNGKDTEEKVIPVGVTGDDNVIVPYGNLFVNAWLIAVCKAEICPPVTKKASEAMKGIIYQPVRR